MFQRVLVLLSVILLIGCGSDKDPIQPSTSSQSEKPSAVGQTHLWGVYNISIDPETAEVTVVPNRNAMFTANVTNFINSKPASLGFQIKGIISGSGYTDVDIDVSITHPFPGLPQYNGYDVRGIFMGDGSGTMLYNNSLTYAIDGTDQFMLPDPVDTYGGPDGYTRWFNYTEFSGGGMPLFQYTQGKAASPSFAGTATLNPYKYFTNILSANDDLFTWLNTHANQNGIFSTGVTNTRNYYLRFPDSKGIKYGYAIIANWKGTSETDHPANAPEAVSVKVTDSSTVYYVDDTDKGGFLNLDIDVWDWDSVISGSGIMEDYQIYVESSVLSAPYQFSPSDMSPTGGTENYSTFHVEIPADNVTGTTGNEYWVIVEQTGFDYSNDFGVPNSAENDTLAAFFRFPLTVGNQGNTPPVINGITDNIPPDGLNTDLDGTVGEVTYSVDFTDPDTGQSHTISWYIEDSSATEPTDPPDNMPYNWLPKPEGAYKIWVKVNDGFGAVTGGPWTVTKSIGGGWARSWGSSGSWDQAWDLATDSSGNIYVSGMFSGNCDFDPSPTGTDYHVASGSFDAYVAKYSPTGNFIWAKTWGGTNEDWAKSVAVTGSTLYVSGYFRTTVPSEQVDFDPSSSGTSYKTSNGDRDGFVSKFDLDGNFQWVQTWGTSNYEWGGEDLAADSSGVYSLGWNEGPWRIDLRKYSSAGALQWSYIWPSGASIVRMESITVNGSNLYFTGLITGSGIDMDPGAGSAPITTGIGDAILCCFNTSGTFQWVKNWGGGSNEIWAQEVTTDSSGNIYVAGPFTGVNVDFDPGPGYDPHSSLDGIGNRDCFLTKFDSSGNHQWAKTWGGAGNEEWVRGLRTDSSNNVYVAGGFRGASINLDPDGSDVRYNTSSGIFDIFFSKFDSTGDYIWGRNIGGTSHDYACDLTVDGNRVYISGSFSSYNMDFDPGSGTDPRSTNGSEDSFLMRVNTNGNY